MGGYFSHERILSSLGHTLAALASGKPLLNINGRTFGSISTVRTSVSPFKNIIVTSNSATCIFPAILLAQDTNDTAGPAVGAVLVPEAGPATVNPDLDHDPTHQLAAANPGLGPTPDPSPLPPREGRWRPSLNPGPGARPHPPRESLGQDLKAKPSRMQRMEVEPHRPHSESIM